MLCPAVIRYAVPARTFADRLQNSGDQRREISRSAPPFPFPPALKNVYPVTAPCVVILRSIVTLDTVNRYLPVAPAAGRR